MGNPQYGRPVLSPVAVDPSYDERPVVLVEVGRGLVEEKDFGSAQQESQERQPGSFAGGQQHGVGVSNLRVKSEGGELLPQRIRLNREMRSDRAVPEARFGGEHSHLPAPLGRRYRLARSSRPRELSPVRIEVGEGPEQAGLARPGGTRNREDAGRRHLEGEWRQVGDGQIADGEHRSIFAVGFVEAFLR